MERDLTQQDWQTLQTAPLWVLTAVVGRQSKFDPLELAAFWRVVDSTAAGSDGLAKTVLEMLSSNFSAQLARYEHNEQSIVAGLWDVMSILNRLDSLVRAPFTAALLEVGEGMSRARGPYGRTISREDKQTLLLLATLLEVEPTIGIFDRDAFA
ncbi:MAG: hypothetical protein ABWZ02_03565 [Nakamurella sp.]